MHRFIHSYFVLYRVFDIGWVQCHEGIFHNWYTKCRFNILNSHMSESLSKGNVYHFSNTYYLVVGRLHTLLNSQQASLRTAYLRYHNKISSCSSILRWQPAKNTSQIISNIDGKICPYLHMIV